MGVSGRHAGIAADSTCDPGWTTHCAILAISIRGRMGSAASLFGASPSPGSSPTCQGAKPVRRTWGIEIAAADTGIGMTTERQAKLSGRCHEPPSGSGEPAWVSPSPASWAATWQ